MSFVCLVHERKERNTLLKILAAVAMLMACLVVTSVRPTQAASPVVILVPGLNRTPADFNAMKPALQSQGYTVYSPALPGNDNVTNAYFLSAYIAAVAPGQHVSIVGFSMGGISARYLIKYLGGGAYVDRLVDISSPNHGAWFGCYDAYLSGGELCPYYPFISQLNSPTEIPGPTAYTALWGAWNDMLLTSNLPMTLTGACNFNFGKLTTVVHDAGPADPIVIGLVEQALVGICPH